MLRNQLQRLLRRAAEHRLTALGVFVVAAGLQLWLMNVPIAHPIATPVVTSARETMSLAGLQPEDTLLHHQGSGGIDMRFERASLAPLTAMLFRQLGVVVPEGDGPISWITTAGTAGDSVLTIARGEATDVPLTLRVHSTPAATRDVVQLELDADAPLKITVGASFIADAPGARKILHLGDQTLELDGGLPLVLNVPPNALLRAVLPVAQAGEALRLPLAGVAATSGSATGQPVRSIAVRSAEGELSAIVCGASPDRLLWRGVGMLADGDCPGDVPLLVDALELGNGRIEAQLSGSGWVWHDNDTASETLYERVTANPAIAALLMLIDAMLAAWLLLAALSLRRRSRYRVFMSYRRDDSAGHSGRIYDRLIESLGADAVFIDVEKIPPGSYFEKVLVARMHAAESVLVIIAPGWLNATNAAGERRLDLPDDFVRREIEMGLALHKRMIPVLVGGAGMPARNDLPESLRRLPELNAVTINHASFDRDTDALAEILVSRPGASTPTDPAPP